jgi:hypothetical protein
LLEHEFAKGRIFSVRERKFWLWLSPIEPLIAAMVSNMLWSNVNVLIYM